MGALRGHWGRYADIRNFFGGQTSTRTKLTESQKPISVRDETRKRSSKRKQVESSDEDIKKKSRSKKRVIIESESDDEDPLPKKNVKRLTRKTKKQQVVIVSDTGSDDEDPLPKKPTSNTRQSSKNTRSKPAVLASGSDDDEEFESTKKSRSRWKSPRKSPIKGQGTIDQFVSPKKKDVAKKKQKTPAKSKPISVADFFGAASVTRSSKPVVAAKKKESKVDMKKNDGSHHNVDELEIHDDSDFEETLIVIDSDAKKPKKPQVEQYVRSRVSPRKDISTTSTGTGIAVDDVQNKAESLPKPVQTLSKTPVNGDRRHDVLPLKIPLIKTVKDEGTSQQKISPRKRTTDERSKSPPPKQAMEEQSMSPTSRRISPRKQAISAQSDSPVHHRRISPRKQTADERSRSPTPVTDATKLAKKQSIAGKLAHKARVNTKEAIGRNAPEKKIDVTAKPSTPVKVLVEDTPPKSETSGVKPSNEPGENKTPSGYKAYLKREGPKHLGAKELPMGGENCLEGLTFVISGVLDSLERDTAKELVERHGGKVTTSVSGRTSYIVLGEEPGESKLAKAQKCGTKQLDEDGLLDLIRTLPAKRSKYEHSPSPKPKVEVSKPSSRAILPNKSQQSSSQECHSQSQPSSSQSASSLLWVDKYKPKKLSEIVGQSGDKSNVKKLVNWLKNWHKNHLSGAPKKAAWGRFGASDDGSSFKAALLSGPPGVGKTTAATLICKELGFNYVERNASDTRSKKLLKEVVTQSVDNNTVTAYFTGGPSDKNVLIMDEVDGMAGNEDRGGLTELISLIKSSKIPVICICNDRHNMKMRSLVNYCYDLRFYRPRVEQIKGALMSIAFKEGVKISPPALEQIIQASNQDIRQVIHNLSMWSAAEKSLTYDQVKVDSSKAKKDIKLGPFDVCRKVFVGGEETAHMTINDKSDLFFHDYSIGPLFVQENYLHVTPYEAKGNKKRHMALLSEAADSIRDGDIVDKMIRKHNEWSLLPTEAMFASVIPGENMRGYVGQMVTFPGWLGKNSTTSKISRLIQDLHMHMHLRISGDKSSLGRDYLPHIRHNLTQPLITKGSDGIAEVMTVMDNYCLLREDIDSIMEVTQWPGSRDPMSQINPKVKGAFTRTYNKEVHLNPYSITSVTNGKRGKTRGGGAEGELDLLGGEGEVAPDSEHSEEEGVTADAMIKQSKAKVAAGSKRKAGVTASKSEKAKGGKTHGSQGTSKARGKGRTK
ncbi:PREDICTED: replication factor C subunit 1-like isoform X2 [Priapulus caudatus]|uniref:Replication factor C subunit 1 n=1 Tax=Priapulus caudatus TaxID=37621 RepID=A0ABM1FB74_PRICU|nr:PREDICTED: replication factor C subunit 1-like isoform X2 [Priapulus caudatus]